MLSNSQLNHKTTQPQPNITLLGLDLKMTLHTPPPTHAPHTNSISAIFQLLMTRFWWNYKDRLPGTSRTDSNCHSDICTGKICPGDICPYKEYLSCYWPHFDQTLKVGSLEFVEQIPTVTVTFFHIRNISAVNNQILMKPKFFWTENLLRHKFFQIFISWTTFFWAKIYCTFFFKPNFFWTNDFWT